MVGAERRKPAAAVDRHPTAPSTDPVCKTAHHAAFIQPDSPHSKQAR
jgi:hypothetical protein